MVNLRGGNAVPAKFSLSLLALDAASGTELRRVPVMSAFALRFRPAEDGVPARLLVLRSAPPVTGSAAQKMELAELDPVTLVERKQTPLPASNDGYRFSADGRWLLSGRAAPLDTRTLQPATLPETVQAELQPPQDTPTRYVLWDFGERFLRVTTRASTAPNTTSTTRFFSTTSGNAFGAPARHPVACSRISSDQMEAPADMVDLPDGGAALAYQDGTVELRDAQDHLRQAVNLGGCQPVMLRADGDVLTFADTYSWELGTLRASDGQVLARRTTATINPSNPPQLLAEGTALVARSPYDSGPLVAMERVTGQAWTLELKMHTLRLDTRATWKSKTEYSSVGTAVLDGEKLNFTATASAGGYELRPQAMPIPPVTWQGELRREDGSVVARIGGSHGKQTPQQAVQLELQGLERDFAFRGSLKP